MFLQQFATNQVKPQKLADLFDMRQKEGESLRAFLNLFCETTIKINSPNEEMFLEAFMNRLQTNPFSEFMLRDRPKTMKKVCRRATTHMDVEETMKQKRA